MLLIDDHKLQRTMLVKQLNDIGVTNIVEAGDGSEVAGLVKETKPHLILCDLEMPVLDGLAVMRILVENNVDAAFVLMSSADEVLLESANLIHEGRPTRFLGTMTKPAKPEELRELAERAQQETETVRPRVPERTLAEILEGYRNKQFRAYFQPIVDAKRGDIVSVEALVRWLHPTLGVLSPAAFLDVAEQQDGTAAITWVVLRDTLQLLATLRDMSLDIGASVNVSAAFIAREGAAEAIAELVSEYEVDPGKLMFEITEASALTTEARVLENLGRLRLRGHQLAADDFGTGYASLRQLVRMPFHVMKLDRFFFCEAVKSPRPRMAFLSAIRLAKELNMETVVEGVETPEHVEFLKDVDVDMHQGYHYGRPMSGADLLARCGTKR